MDYSLLLGIHDLDRSVEDALEQVEEEEDDEDYDSGGSAGKLVEFKGLVSRDTGSV
jgi:hypothetical protein